MTGMTPGLDWDPRRVRQSFSKAPCPSPSPSVSPLGAQTPGESPELSALCLMSFRRKVIRSQQRCLISSPPSCLFCVPAFPTTSPMPWPIPPQYLGKAHKGPREVSEPAEQRAPCIRPGEWVFKKHLLCASYQSRPFP